MAEGTITIRNARLIFRNFSGEETQYNPAGRRNFAVILGEEDAQKLSADGWNVKVLKPRDEEEEPESYIQVGVSFNAYPPKIVVISGENKTIIDEASIGMLDWAEIIKCDLTIRPYNWEIAGREGTKAYVKSMYVTVEEDELSAEYGI